MEYLKTLGSIVMTREEEDEKRALNKSDIQINRGFELMIRDHTKREVKPSRSFGINLAKTLTLFSREFGFSFSLSFSSKKN